MWQILIVITTIWKILVKYIAKEQDMADRLAKLDHLQIPEGLDYARGKGKRANDPDKLNKRFRELGWLFKEMGNTWEFGNMLVLWSPNMGRHKFFLVKSHFLSFSMINLFPQSANIVRFYFANLRNPNLNGNLWSISIELYYCVNKNMMSLWKNWKIFIINKGQPKLHILTLELKKCKHWQ